MRLILLMAAAQLLSDGAPLDRPVHVLSEGEGQGDYVSAPHRTAEDRRTAWSWSVSRTAGGEILIDAFLNENDCGASSFLRIRQERYRDSTLYDTRMGNTAFRPPHWLEMEARLVRDICTDRVEGLVQIDSVHAAAGRISAPR